MNHNLPEISIIIPCLNEKDFIHDCISSLVDGNYPSRLLEVLVIDGGSTDSTIDIVNNLNSKESSIRIINNPKRIVPTALNLGVSEAKHNIILLAGAHAIYDDNYILQSVTTLLSENCASVGGVITPTAKTQTGKAIAIATSSKFGIGNAKYRYAKEKQSVDTVFAGCLLKQSIEKIGGFNEAWVRNQDYELNHRLRDQVGPIILDPLVKCSYFCRETLKGLAKQYFGYGYWRFKTLTRHKSSFSARQAAPLLLLAGLIISAILISFKSPLGLIIPTTYLMACLISSVTISAQKNKFQYALILPIVFATIHISWALGFAKSVLTQR